ncbi:bifunctional DNA-formamidopyrimidine glycosylase/DNA-(apurinic or apyrimidinic site) lyase [Candidatus Daviesbacteria bacterium]|nr:bifunctional DNA-formamidopyrimidine glycosylase/DNA-(apurinic or apyrimidinic site) lyase [Candidatus Daviesbacteria bacterium]
MPELPEVETIKLGLEKKIVGLTIKEVEVRSKRTFLGDEKKVKDKKIVKVWRRAKLLGIDLAAGTGNSGQGTVKKNSKLKPVTSNLYTLLFHLKMSGQLIWEGYRLQGTGDSRFIGGHPTSDMLGKLPNSHTRVIFTFSNGSKLYFNDQRKFGWVKIVDSGQVTGDSSLKNLGPEPLGKGFSWQVLKTNLLRHKSMPVKVAIMDQSVVAGVGNIYANEACFDARLDPRAKVSELRNKEFKRLHLGIIKCLKDGIKYGGSTRVHFVDPEGHKGYFLDYAYVYWKDKHPCKVCGTIIEKIKLGGRGTYFCPACQR